MGYDGKYGEVSCEFGTIGQEEPVFVFRAQDKLLPDLLLAYHQICKDHGASDHHLGLIEDQRQRILRWQADPNNFTKMPSSTSEAGQRYWERNSGR